VDDELFGLAHRRVIVPRRTDVRSSTSHVRYNGAVRLLIPLAVPLSAIALAGCGSDVQAELVWAGPPDAGTGGVVSTDGFATYQGEVDEDWERSPALAAGVFLRLDERKAVHTTIEAEAGPEGTGSQTVVVTLDGIPDDSVRAERWRLRFTQEGDVYALTAALREVRCRAGRGHEEFSAELCA
jgi:hypothetical protein